MTVKQMVAYAKQIDEMTLSASDKLALRIKLTIVSFVEDIGVMPDRKWLNAEMKLAEIESRKNATGS